VDVTKGSETTYAGGASDGEEFPGLVDIVAAGFDAGIRLGEMIAQDGVAVRLTGSFQATMVAAPA
jgi:hypothetical protein